MPAGATCSVNDTHLHLAPTLVALHLNDSQVVYKGSLHNHKKIQPRNPLKPLKSVYRISPEYSAPEARSKGETKSKTTKMHGESIYVQR